MDIIVSNTLSGTNIFKDLNSAINYLKNNYSKSNNTVYIDSGVYNLSLTKNFYDYCFNSKLIICGYSSSNNKTFENNIIQISGGYDGAGSTSKTIIFRNLVIDISTNNYSYAFCVKDKLQFENCVIKGYASNYSTYWGMFGACWNNIYFYCCTDLTGLSDLFKDGSFNGYSGRIYLNNCIGKFGGNSSKVNTTIRSTPSINSKYRLLNYDNSTYGVYCQINQNNKGWEESAKCLIKMKNNYYTINENYYDKENHLFRKIDSIDFSIGFEISQLTENVNFDGKIFKPIELFDEFQIVFSENYGNISNLIINSDTEKNTLELLNFDYFTNLYNLNITGSDDIKFLIKLKKINESEYYYYSFDEINSILEKVEIEDIEENGIVLNNINQINFLDKNIKNIFDLSNMKIVVFLPNVNSYINNINYSFLKNMEYIFENNIFDIYFKNEKIFLKSKINSKEIIVNYL